MAKVPLKGLGSVRLEDQSDSLAQSKPTGPDQNRVPFRFWVLVLKSGLLCVGPFGPLSLIGATLLFVVVFSDVNALVAKDVGFR